MTTTVASSRAPMLLSDENQNIFFESRDIVSLPLPKFLRPQRRPSKRSRSAGAQPALEPPYRRPPPPKPPPWNPPPPKPPPWNPPPKLSCPRAEKPLVVPPCPKPLKGPERTPGERSPNPRAPRSSGKLR